MPPARIALDAMGGDEAPGEIVAGALQALEGEDCLAAEQVALVGDSEQIAASLEECGGNPGFEIIHAAQVVEMGEDPRSAMRSKPDNSISQAAELVKRGDASGLVSMGNTGMVVAASTLLLGRLPGIRMPAIAVTAGFTGRPLVLVDMGANVDPSAVNLLHNAVMGSIYAQDCLGIAAPRVGLLNIGGEPEKGPKLYKEAHGLLAKSELAFIGNVEGGDIFGDCVDVIVTDGFTGNVILKTLEQFAAFILEKISIGASEHNAELPSAIFQGIGRDLDYAAYGGALLLGVNGVVVIGHGKSDSRAVSNALRQASRANAAGVNQHIIAGLEACGMA